ncbi:flagellar biosynthetic protein FlhB [Sulfobacillus thermosulfidooxidans DSM 9293]|uniref:Flagellar biosynthetic protein FlhB n=1 Tax=Sulfobacillus thermosulfidooxidans (strain DSM 9293 / VKM B-1269 / AT-1) TaxID=929705 RepID=A0A1W1WEL4_SULTA|nr:EscU/YscU/HrcU family type III secretion system export apparatus switch protein [Sulfobacillus thermosulfidooxidans]SMC04609.1 flagellar biosynthetic protein FlhB [Sulfobacillus thermosulfidooxidans DSM 9293]
MSHLSLSLPRMYFASAGEKSQQATPHKKQQLQKQGQHWKSPDFQAALALAVGFVVIRHYLPWAGTQLGEMESAVLQLAENPQGTMASAWLLAFSVMIRILLPLTLPLLVAGLFASSLEKGFRLSFSALKADMTRLNPVEGLKRMFSRDSVWQLFKGLLKVGIMGALAAWVIHQQLANYAGLMVESLGQALSTSLNMLSQVLLVMSVAFFIIGVLDMAYQAYAFQLKIRMTTQEVRDELKETEGNPQIKGKRREMARRIWRSGVRQVKNAQVVITNPTHYAVALKWDEKTMPAPVVIAKGADEMAYNIREIAVRHGVPLVENPPLARSLYEVPIGHVILEEHYQAVADILAFLIRKRHAHRMERRH